MINIYTYLIDFAYLLLKTIAETCLFLHPIPTKTWNFDGGAAWTSMRLERGGWRGFGAVFQHPTRSAELYTRSPCIHVSAFSKGWKWLKSCLWKRHQTTKQKETQERKQHFPQRTVNFSQFTVCHHQISCLCLPFTPCTSTATSPNILLSWSQFETWFRSDDMSHTSTSFWDVKMVKR